VGSPSRRRAGEDNYEKIKAASGEIADILRETYSTNAKGAADYGSKSSRSRASTPTPLSIFSPISWIRSRYRKSCSCQPSRTARNFEVVSAQNKELWELAPESRDRDGRADQEELHQSPVESRLNRTYRPPGSAGTSASREIGAVSRRRTDMLPGQKSETGRINMASL